ncbi:RagB/SusD family nutrient uptake outer membrane protein [Bacteroides finegoldii]|uniref:RagB/SusD family nutrient uptake outer membrane protein n=1 Tax=Bacteroides finegoldii TaxID=338188 RepID=UPI0018A07B7C|nr:RagB/SusD family nutrient uptake outer membrane protein [Bacteroides finegoldii]
MKINHIIRITILVTAGLWLASCEKIFDELAIHPNQQDVNGFYTNPENINLGIIGIYSYITAPRAMGASGLGLICNRGDEGSARSDYASPGQYTSALTPSYYTIVQPYQLLYTAMAQACQMIEVIPGVDFKSEAQKNAYLGEAYFLRAWCHFFLLTNYRNILLMDRKPESARDFRPQAEPEAVWELIVADLIQAKGLLPPKGYWDTAYPGRATSGAAAAMLGKAYLYRSGIEKYYGNSSATYYDEAAAAFDEVISGRHGTYSLVDYSWNFDVAHENNDESVFEFQFLGDAVNTSFNPGLPESGVWKDPRGFYPPNTDKGNTAQDQVMHEWVYQAFIHSKDADGRTDSRMFGTLIFDDSSSDILARAGDRVTVFDGKTYGETYGKKGFGLSNVKAAKYKSAGRKWLDWDLPTVDPGNKMYFYYQRAHGVNFRYIRYADVLLMYAEAVVSGGRQGSLTPLEAVNRVRARSGVDMPPLPTVDRAAIENERILELTGEGHRYFDLLRWGKVAQRFRELEATDPDFKQYGMSAYLGFQEGRDEWLPIPLDEVEGNPYITANNPGW